MIWLLPVPTKTPRFDTRCWLNCRSIAVGNKTRCPKKHRGAPLTGISVSVFIFRPKWTSWAQRRMEAPTPSSSSLQRLCLCWTESSLGYRRMPKRSVFASVSDAAGRASNLFFALKSSFICPKAAFLQFSRTQFIVFNYYLFFGCFNFSFWSGLSRCLVYPFIIVCLWRGSFGYAWCSYKEW